MKELGITINADKITLLELNFWHIMEVELNKAQDAKSKREAKKESKKVKK